MLALPHEVRTKFEFHENEHSFAAHLPWARLPLDPQCCNFVSYWLHKMSSLRGGYSPLIR